jgi:putative cardiolipin synthase
MGRIGRVIVVSTLAALLSACAAIEPRPHSIAQEALPPAPLEAWPGLAGHVEENQIVPLNRGGLALQWRLRALRAATRSIDLQTFIWKGDGVGLALVREVFAAAERGVRVRILIDDSFLAHADDALLALSGHPNINYRIYNPAARRDGDMIMRQLGNLNDFQRINHRMHNKLLVVDGRLAILGGRNQADEYFGYQHHHNFRDFELVVSGPILSQLSDVFDLYWNDPWSLAIQDFHQSDGEWDLDSIESWLDDNAVAHGELPHSDPEDWSALFSLGYPAQIELLVDSPPDVEHGLEVPVQLAEALIERIDATNRDMVLVSAYFIPTEHLMAAIERATRRGVRLRIFTNSLGANNHVSAHAAYAAHRPSLLAAGAEIYELRPDAQSRTYYLEPEVVDTRLGLHEKGALFDDCCLFVGSANLDPRSLRINTEVGLFIDSPALNARLRQMLTTDLMPDNAWEVQLDERGEVLWVGPDGQQRHAPPASFYLRMESWFFGLLPIEDQL